MLEPVGTTNILYCVFHSDLFHFGNITVELFLYGKMLQESLPHGSFFL